MRLRANPPPPKPAPCTITIDCTQTESAVQAVPLRLRTQPDQSDTDQINHGQYGTSLRETAFKQPHDAGRLQSSNRRQNSPEVEGKTLPAFDILMQRAKAS